MSIKQCPPPHLMLVICIPVADLCNLTIVLHVPIRVSCLGRTVLLCVAVWNWPTCCADWLIWLIWWQVFKEKKKKTLIRSKCWFGRYCMLKQDHYGVCSSIFMNYGSKERHRIKVVNVKEIFVSYHLIFTEKKTAS